VKIIADKETGRSRGFAFVDLDSERGGEGGYRRAERKDFGGRPLKVNEAEEKRAGRRSLRRGRRLRGTPHGKEAQGGQRGFGCAVRPRTCPRQASAAEGGAGTRGS